MGETTKIEWCDHTFNPWRGCTKVSAGCAHCYAETMSKRNPGILGVWGDGGTRVVASPAAWREPVKWDREAGRDGVRRRVFCASLADVFEDRTGHVHDSQGNVLWYEGEQGVISAGATTPRLSRGERPATLDDVRNRLRWLMFETPNLDWLLLTKRPEYAAAFIADHLMPDNVWLGTSIEDQATADERIPHLLRTPAAVRFLSVEPMLGPIDLRLCPHPEDRLSCPRDEPEDSPVGCAPCESGRHWVNGFAWDMYPTPRYPEVPRRHCGLDWVIVGGESGPKARPMHPSWARSIRDQCQAAGVPFLFKQWGEWLPISEMPGDGADGLYRPNRVAKPDEDQGRIDDIYGRTCKVETRAIDFGGATDPPEYAAWQLVDGHPVYQTFRVGKKAAGRTLDGRTWDEFPSPSLEPSRA